MNFINYKMKFVLNFIILSILLLKYTIESQSVVYTREIITKSGPMTGLELKTVIKSIPYFAFKGIPYAEPPVNNLRFQPPVPKQAWSNTFLAINDANRCIQMEKRNVVGSEDCLYLNVYSPNITEGTDLKAVMVWIHGGAFTTGNGNSSYYGPDFLVEENVVVVSMNYRLGPLGFLNIHHPDVSGNNGLKDQNLALKWVKQNIRQFGGDPEKVTLVGQSAGAVSVDLHTLSDMSKGLFSATISMSGSPLCLYWTFQSSIEAEIQAFLLGSKFKLKGDSKDELIAVLKNASANDIVEKASELRLIPFRPTLEKADVAPDQPKFLIDCTPKIYREGTYNKGPHMMGFTSTEILTLVDTLDDIVRYTSDASSIITKQTPVGKLPVIPKIISTSFDEIKNLETSALLLLINELSDLYFVTGIDKKQQLLSKNNDNPIFYYRFNYRSIYSAHKYDGVKYLDGVGHEDELPYIFYRPHLNLPLNNPGIAATRERLVKLWTNFAKYKNPTPEKSNEILLNLNWPDSSKDGSHLEISETLKIKERPTNILIDFYQLIGLGDSIVINDCVTNVLSNIINDLEKLPVVGSVLKKILNPFNLLIPMIFG